MKHSLKVGQVVYVAGGLHQGLHETVIEKIGTKYFYIGRGWRKIQVCIDRLISTKESNYPHRVYLTREAYNDEVNREKYSRFIVSKSNHQLNKLTIEDLKTIHEILSKYEEQD